MTDGLNFFKKGIFANRAGVHRNRPAIIDMNIFGKVIPDRIEELKAVEDRGLTALHIRQGADGPMMKGIPDMFGMTQEQINATPEYIRHVKCEGAIEKGNPTCEANKYSDAGCSKRMHKAGWHPGWRVHAMYGYTIGLFLIDALNQAIVGLGPNDYDPVAKLQELKAEEDKDYDTFFQSTIEPDRVKGFLNVTITSELDPNIFYRGRSICHTALLPAETRYKGYLTGVKTVDGDYEKGKSRDELDKEPANGTMRIAIVTKERQEWCPVTLKIDFKDHFYANENDGWLSLTFPNDAELEAYGPWEPKGVILICFGNCDWGKCPQGDRRMNDDNKQQLEITINNVPVTRLWSMSNDECGIAQAADGWYFPKNDEGRFKVAVKVGPNGEQWLAYTRITSIIAL